VWHPPRGLSLDLVASPQIPIRHLSPAEMQDRRAKGLCFNCDEHFGSNDRCRAKQFLLLLADESEYYSYFSIISFISSFISGVHLARIWNTVL